MNVDIHGAPIYFTIPVFGGIPITASLVVSWGVMLVLTGLCIWLTHGMKVKNISKRQAVAEKGLLGCLTGGLGAAAGGITASLLCGVLAALLFKSRDQN